MPNPSLWTRFDPTRCLLPVRDRREQSPAHQLRRPAVNYKIWRLCEKVGIVGGIAGFVNCFEIVENPSGCNFALQPFSSSSGGQWTGDFLSANAPGLAGGGWQTIVLSALDERVKATHPVAGFSSLRSRVEVKEYGDMGDVEQSGSEPGTPMSPCLQP